MHPNYSQLLSGAHRKPATPIGTPTLVCHLALWQPVAPAVGDQPPKPVAGDDWRHSIDIYLQRLFCLLKDYSVTSPNTDSPVWEESKYLFLFSRAIDLKSTRYDLVTAEDLMKAAPHIDRYFASAYQSIVLQFNWHHLKASIRFERHTEYLQITSLLDFGHEVYESQSSTADGEVYRRVHGALIALDENLDLRQKELCDVEKDERIKISDKERRTLGDIHLTLYEKVWTDFFDEILLSRRPLRDSGVDLTSTVADHYKAIGYVFADFRGLILNCKYPNTKIAQQSKFFQRPGWVVYRPRSIGNVVNPLTSEEAHFLARAFWPFVTSEFRLQLNKFEFSVSRMLGNRALYVTALGAQPSPYLGPTIDREPGQLPVFYLAYLHTFRRWQIGRLVDRINHLGTVRIAAIQENDTLRANSAELRDLSGPVDEYLSQLKDKSSLDARSVRVVWAQIANAQNKISNWNRQIIGGLPYRIERSRYYVKQFRDGLPALRIRRVEGYQPYDVFVEHRLGATYDFIDRLGTRLERFERRLNVLYQYLLAKAIMKLQVLAEGFFFGIAAPYYFIETVKLVFGTTDSSVIRFLDPLTINGAIWVFFILWALVRVAILLRKP